MSDAQPDQSATAAVLHTLRRRGVPLLALFVPCHVATYLLQEVLFPAREMWTFDAYAVQALFGLVTLAPIAVGTLWTARDDTRREAAQAERPLLGGVVDGLGRWGAVIPAYLVYANRLSVGGVLGLLPGLVWWVQGRFLVQVVALRHDVPPFEYSRAVSRGAWWPLLGLTTLAFVSQVGVLVGADAAFTVALGPDVRYAREAGLGALAALHAAAWCVIDTVVFLRLERRNGLAPAAPAG